ncbi:MAG: plasmid stabilization system [Acidobacteria bacterium]|nr:plasmid stabilization system [Acidobacteriota bacterium]
MKKYSVIFHPDAETDIDSAYQWGRQVWGDQQAKAWLREIQRAIKLRLTSLPLSCPLAPESNDLGIAVRQLIVQRYRILFIVDKKSTTILHVRGSYAASLDPSDEVHK